MLWNGYRDAVDGCFYFTMMIGMLWMDAMILHVDAVGPTVCIAVDAETKLQDEKCTFK